MPIPTNLYEYYTSKGQSLPSISERANIFQQQGLGNANTYTGTAEQNTSLLNKLQTPIQASTPTSAPTISGQNQAIVSSDLARNQYNQDLKTLQSKENQYSYVDTQGNTKTINASNPQEAIKNAPDISLTSGVQKEPVALNFTSANIALQSLIGQLNDLVKQRKLQGISLTPEEQAKLDEINNFQQQKTISISEARTAADNKDAKSLNENLTQANQAEISQQDTLKSLMADLKTSRQGMITALTPTEREQQLKTQLNTLRTDRQLLPIELRQQGISAEGIRTGQINDERVRAIQESNLLAEIGLEQDARKMSLESATQQANFIAQNIDLQMKIQDKLDAKEQKVVEEARNLRKDSLTALSSITDSFKGLAWEDLDAQTQADLVDTAKQFNIPVNLISNALKIAKQQQVFDNAIKRQNAKSAETDNNKIIKDFSKSLADRNALNVAGTREQFIRQLIAQYPQIDEQSIKDYVYATYPDFYEGTKNQSAINNYVQKVKSGDIDLSNVPADLRNEVAGKL